MFVETRGFELFVLMSFNLSNVMSERYFCKNQQNGHHSVSTRLVLLVNVIHRWLTRSTVKTNYSLYFFHFDNYFIGLF